MADLILKDESFKIVGLCMEVHKALGMGFKEIINKDALEIEFKKKKFHVAEKKSSLFHIRDKFYHILMQLILLCTTQ